MREGEKSIYLYSKNVHTNFFFFRRDKILLIMIHSESSSRWPNRLLTKADRRAPYSATDLQASLCRETLELQVSRLAKEQYVEALEVIAYRYSLVSTRRYTHGGNTSGPRHGVRGITHP